MSVAFPKDGSPLATKTGYKQYNYNSPWIVPIQIIDKKAEAEELADLAATSAAMDFGGAGAFYSEELSKSAKNVSGYRIKVSKKAPDFMWYQKNFTNYATGETPNRAKDTDASKTVKMPS